jgi:hypothetical protein
MIPTLHIEKQEPGLYLCRVLEGRAEVAEYDCPTIGSSIREAAQAYPDAIAWHIWYGHVCIGTTMRLNMIHDPETLALKAMALHGQVR